MKLADDPLRLRLALTLLGIVVGFFGLWRFTNGCLDVQGISFFLCLLGFPYALYLLLLRTWEGSLWTGLLLICVIVGVQIMVTSAWERGSSTAPLGYFWLPLAGSFLVGAAAVIDRSWSSATFVRAVR